MSHSADHAIARAKERYGVDLILCDLSNIVHQITSKRSLLCAKSYSAERHLVSYRGTTYVVMYAPQSRIIVTFLPRQNAVSFKKVNSPSRQGSGVKPRRKQQGQDDEEGCYRAI